jgi:hypothetical protein
MHTSSWFPPNAITTPLDIHVGTAPTISKISSHPSSVKAADSVYQLLEVNNTFSCSSNIDINIIVTISIYIYTHTHPHSAANS